jgi:hypothetical protein
MLEKLDLRDVATLLQIALGLIAMSGIITTGHILWLKFRLKDTFASKEDVAGLQTSMSTLSDRVEGVEKGLAALPTHDEVRSIRHNVANLAMQVPALAEKVEGQAALMRGIDDRLQMVLQELISARTKT